MPSNYLNGHSKHVSHFCEYNVLQYIYTKRINNMNSQLNRALTYLFKFVVNAA